MRTVGPGCDELLDATMMGLHLDLPLERGSRSLDRAVSDLADAVDTIAKT